MNLTCFYIFGYQNPISVRASHPFQQNVTCTYSPTYLNIRLEYFSISLLKKKKKKEKKKVVITHKVKHILAVFDIKM